MKIGNREFETSKHTYIMGILNVTPNSFSDGGKYTKQDHILFRVENMIAEGMDILDIGGESTKPGYEMISEEEEISRVIPIIQEIKSRFDIPISIDTYKSKVAKASISAGVDLINDIWGLKYDNKMATVIADSSLPCCLMHNRKEVYTVSGDLEEDITFKGQACSGFMQELIKELEESLQIAENAGISHDRIILDPGVGFGKNYENNLEVIDSMEVLLRMGYPLLLGASKKSVIGEALSLPVTERMEGTLVTTVFAVLKGCAFVRVHDIKENARTIQMAEAILKRK